MLGLHIRGLIAYEPVPWSAQGDQKIKEKKLPISELLFLSKFHKHDQKRTPKGFKKVKPSSHSTPIVSNDLSLIKNGMSVKHAKFGKGKIIEISGENFDKKATIFFENFGQKQLLLRFANLEIL